MLWHRPLQRDTPQWQTYKFYTQWLTHKHTHLWTSGYSSCRISNSLVPTPEPVPKEKYIKLNFPNNTLTSSHGVQQEEWLETVTVFSCFTNCLWNLLLILMPIHFVPNSPNISHMWLNVVESKQHLFSLANQPKVTSQKWTMPAYKSMMTRYFLLP